MTMSGGGAPVAEGGAFRNLSTRVIDPAAEKEEAGSPHGAARGGDAMEYMFLPLKRYAEFSGRSRRMEYWMFALFLFILWIVLFGLFMVMAGSIFLSAMGGSPTGVFAAGGTAMILGL